MMVKVVTITCGRFRHFFLGVSSMRVVIIGAGYAGLTVALRLARAEYPGEVVLVNDGPYHQLLTQMHRVAVGAIGSDKVLLRLESLLRWSGVRFVQGKVTEIDPKQRRVRLEDETALEYDRLVVGLGSHVETFGVEGVREHALTVQPLQRAIATQHHITARLHDATFSEGEERAAALRFVVVGGGLTGVEVAGELADRVPQEGRRLGIRPEEIEIIIMEAGRRLLPGLHEDVVADAAAILARKDVDVRTETPVTKIVGSQSQYDDSALGVIVRDGEFIPARTVIWAAGVRGHALVEQSFAADRSGRAFVDEFLRARDYPDVYIVGDSALAVPHGGTKPVAPTAQNAVQQAGLVAHNLVEEAEKGDAARLRPYAAKSAGVFVSVGQGEAVGELVVSDVWKPRLSGVSAYAMKWASEQRYKMGIGL